MKTYEAQVPESIVNPYDPENESPEGEPITVEFEWVAGSPPSGLSGPPENYDPSSGDEFYITAPDLPEDQEERVINWLDEHWERPTDEGDPDYLAEMRAEDALLGRAEEDGL